jgi:pseudomonalisin
MLSRLVPCATIAMLVLGVTAASATTVDVGTLAGVRDLGRATTSTPVHIAVALNYHHAAELEALVDAQGDPSATLYGRFLSPAQFNQYFSPTPAEYGRVIAALRRGGFTITNTFPNRTIVDATAPAPVAGRFFNTEIHRVMTPDVGVRITNVRAGVVPAQIGDLVLDTVRHMRPTIAFLPKGAARPVRPMVHGAAAPLFGPDGGYGPQVFINSYDLPAINGMTGTGRASGMIGDADFTDSDLSTYLSYFQVTRTGPATTRVLVDGGPPPGNGGPDTGEATLDAETLVSLAPGTALYSYEVPSSATLQYFIDGYNKIVSDNKVDTVNTSYSECETAFIPTFPTMAQHVELQGNALGITFHASSGDDGVHTYGCGNTVSVGTPTDTPNNISVGGTRMTVNSQTGFETSEIGWADSSGATGGGVSVVFKKVPKYQRKVMNVIKPGRNLPDVAFDASPFTGESWYVEGGWNGPIGGTSLASPIFGAALTEIDQLRNKRAGFFNRPLYNTWKKHGYMNGSTLYWRDITVGSIPPYGAKTGYDQMTGIGAMDATNFGKLLP